MSLRIRAWRLVAGALLAAAGGTMAQPAANPAASASAPAPATSTATTQRGKPAANACLKEEQACSTKKGTPSCCSGLVCAGVPNSMCISGR